MKSEMNSPLWDLGSSRSAGWQWYSPSRDCYGSDAVGWSIGRVGNQRHHNCHGGGLFLIPSSDRHSERLLTWRDTRNLPWDILLLFGGGLTLAKELAEAEVLTMVAQALASWDGVSQGLLVLLFAGVALLLTEVMSNLALTVVMVPIVGQIALEWGVNPMLLVIPVTIASSCAFVYPWRRPQCDHFWQPTHYHQENGFGGLVLNDCGRARMGLGCGFCRSGWSSSLSCEAHCHIEWAQLELVGHTGARCVRPSNPGGLGGKVGCFRRAHGMEVICFQSNVEGELIDAIQTDLMPMPS